MKIEEFLSKVEEVNYVVSPTDLKEMIDQLRITYDSINSQLSPIEKLTLIAGKIRGNRSVEVDVDHLNVPYLDVYTGFSGLIFRFNEEGQFVLYEESWYEKGCVYHRHNLPVDTSKINEIIDLFVQEGRGKCRNNPLLDILIQERL